MNQEQMTIFLREIEKQTSWGKNQLKDLIMKIQNGIIK